MAIVNCQNTNAKPAVSIITGRDSGPDVVGDALVDALQFFVDATAQTADRIVQQREDEREWPERNPQAEVVMVRDLRLLALLPLIPCGFVIGVLRVAVACFAEPRCLFEVP